MKAIGVLTEGAVLGLFGCEVLAQVLRWGAGVAAVLRAGAVWGIAVVAIIIMLPAAS